MQEASFYERVGAAMSTPPGERHQQLLRLHTEALQTYQVALQRLSAGVVDRPLAGTSDQRTVAEIVGHIAAWDRFALLAAGDILAGIQYPRMVADLAGYREVDGSFPAFVSIDDFNAYQGDRYRAWPWETLRAFAADTALTLHALFAHPQLLTATRLEATAPSWKRLQNGTRIEAITMGWSLWLTMLEHLAVEHANLVDMYGRV
ncbi:MAG TPA: hypothetical protein VFU22_14490 [Roseiflexaceae bacterium]|nr:hypothetical protein [Roseiflexaceae bacterium]